MCAALTVALSACDAPPPDTSSAPRDSLGVTIVESGSPAWSDADRFVVDPVPSLDLSTTGEGPDHEFFRLRDAARLPDGSILVASYGAREVRRYDPDGRHVWSFGTEGDGPGEFRQIASVDAYVADSILVFDYWQQRVTVLGPDGVLGRTSSIRQPTGHASELYSLPGGRLVLRSGALELMEARRGRTRIPEPVLLLDPEGSMLDTITVAAGFETYVVETGDARPAFPKASHSRAMRDFIVLGEADVLGYEVFGIDGTLRQVARVPSFDVTVTDHQRDSASESMRSRRVPPQYREVFDRLATDIPDVRPAYTDLELDALGYVWLGSEYDQLALPEWRTWFVFDPAGTWLGEVELPGRFTPYEIGEDYVLGRSTDDLDVETIQLLGLTR